MDRFLTVSIGAVRHAIHTFIQLSLHFLALIKWPVLLKEDLLHLEQVDSMTPAFEKDQQTIEETPCVAGHTRGWFCLLYWEQGDPRFKQEGRKLAQRFRDVLGYQVLEISIPHDDPFQSVFEQINGLMRTSNNTLRDPGETGCIVLYYAGYGDPNNDPDNKDRWHLVLAEQNNGGAILEWFQIQPLLGRLEADLLLLFDACYAASAVRTRPYEPMDGRAGKIELLAASTHFTRMPGEGSFTAAFIEEFEKHFARPLAEPLAIEEMEFFNLQYLPFHRRIRGETIRFSRLQLPSTA